MKNHAILIMAHKNPDQIIRLVRFFPKNQCVCFIHIDAKSSIDKNELKTQFENEKANAIVIDESISGVLACWSLVEVSILLLKQAIQYEREHQIRFDHFRLLSGQDYPIKSFSEYDTFLNEKPDEYVGIQFADEEQEVREKFLRWRYPRPREYAALHSKRKLWNTISIGWCHLFEIVKTRIIGTPEEFLIKHHVKPVGGPSWWTISHNLADEILDEYEKNGMITRVIRQTATPEESYIQTIYANSALYKGERPGNLTIGNYGRREQRVTGHTYPFRKEDYDELMNCGDFFARKFDMDVDSEILDMLDKRIYEWNK